MIRKYVDKKAKFVSFFDDTDGSYIRTGIIENGKWVGNRYYKECEYTYTCTSGTKINNSYCFKTY